MLKKVFFLMGMLVVWLNFLGFSEMVSAEGFEYFDSEINYWEEKIKVQPQRKKSVKKKNNKTSKFDWSKYLDPERDEFFKEGSYMPPAPFMEVYRRPTKENVLMWDAYIKKRSFIHQRALKNIKKYLSPSASQLKKIIVEKKNYLELQKIREVFKGKWIVFYFDKNCSHCKKMYRVLNKLALNGILVQAVRLDHGTGVVKGLSIPWEPIKKGEQKRLKINVTPTTLVVEEKSKKVIRLTGSKTLEEIVGQVNSN